MSATATDELGIGNEIEASALVEAAVRQRARAPRPAAKAALPVTDDTASGMSDDLFEMIDDGGPQVKAKRKPQRAVLEGLAPGAPVAAELPTARRRRPERGEPKPVKPAPRPAKPVEPGLITRGVHVGMAVGSGSAALSRKLGMWGMALVTACLSVAVLGGFAGAAIPTQAPVGGIRITYLDGPRIADHELFALVRRYPRVNDLKRAEDADLTAFSGWLASQPAVREVAQVCCRHEPDGRKRTVEIVLGLRQPWLPVVLASGSRAWLDQDGRLLPGILPIVDQRPRPVVRGIEGIDAERLAEALWLWCALDRVIEPGLIRDLLLDEDLQLKGQRGIVLVTRDGARILWGRPDDVRYGVERERKVQDLLHTLRCQGDTARLATINVRFQKPYFTLR